MVDIDLNFCGSDKGDATSDTLTIQSVIDSVALDGGGRVTFKSGRTYRCGSIRIKAGVELHFERESALIASSNYEDYSAEHLVGNVTNGGVNETVLPRRAFIVGYQAHGAKITGTGVINGNAEGFILTRGKYIHEMRAPENGRNQYLERPFTIFLIESNGVELSGITVKDPAFWAIRLTGCNSSRIHGIKIHSDLMVPNADGIDIDRCRDVEISGCELITADDCISIKSCAGTSQYGSVENVIISDCKMVSTSGAITIGTESVGNINKVLVANCNVKQSHRGFAVRAREGGAISNITFKDSRIETRAFSPSWWGHGEALHVTAFAWNQEGYLGDGNPERLLPGHVSDILFENLDVESEAGMLVWAQDPSLIRNVTFRNVRVSLSKSSKWPSRIDLRPNDVTPLIERKHNAFEFVNCRNITISDCRVVWDHTRSEYLAELHQEGVSDLLIDNLTETIDN
ncbi:MAG: hypothetical protein K9G12_03615 [Candidatus Nanopelagicales bacterium]|nr:hypothetical protein [Candidatus Nanopelagicales bacterium]